MYRALVFCCWLTLPALAQIPSQNDKNTLPEIGVVASNAISIDKEQQIGQVLMRQLRARAPLVSDPLLDEYIQDLGNRLVAQADNAKFPFTFFLIANPEINAFAFFGGHVAVHTGLIIEAQNESELASVIGHEIAHVTQRHIARSIEAQQKASPLQLVSALGGILLAMSNPEAGIAAISAGSAAAQQAAINYTRSNEKEADRVGIDILYRAGYDPAGSASFFAKLAAKYRHQSKPPAFLLTHPLPESRVADVRARQDDYPTVTLPPSLPVYLVKARLQARYGENQALNIQYFRDQLQQASHPVAMQAAKYGLALSLLANDQVREAEMLINDLRQAAPENLFYLDTYADIAVHKGQYQQAIDLLQLQAQRQPRNRVLVLNLATLLLKNKQHEQAVRLLKDYLLVNPEHLLTHQLLADAYGESRKMLEMHQTKAEVYALVAAYPRAIDELQTAYNYAAQSPLEKQRIRARIEQLRDEQNRLKSL